MSLDVTTRCVKCKTDIVECPDCGKQYCPDCDVECQTCVGPYKKIVRLLKEAKELAQNETDNWLEDQLRYLIEEVEELTAA